MNKKLSYLLLLFVTSVTAFLIYTTVQNIRFDYDFDNFFSENDTEFTRYDEFRSTYENDSDYLLVAIPNKPSIFDSTFLKKVYSLQQEIKLIKDVTKVTSLLNSRDRIIFENPMTGSNTPVDIPFIHKDDFTRLKKDSTFIFSRRELIGNFTNSRGDHIVIIVNQTPKIQGEKAISMLDSLYACIDKSGLKDVKVAGKSVVEVDYISRMQVEFISFAGGALVLIVVFLYISFRSLWGIWIPTLTVVICVIWAIGAMVLLGQSIDILTTLLPTIMFIVGISDVIHIFSKYLELLRDGKSKKTALFFTVKEVGLATLLTSITTSIGFATLITTGVKPISNFGIYTAVGVILAFVIAFTLLPSLLYILPKPKIVSQPNNGVFWNKHLHRFLRFVLSNKKSISLTSLVVIGISIWGVSRIQENAFLVGEVSKDDPLRQQFAFFEKEFGGARPFEVVVDIKNTDISDPEVWEELEKLEIYLNTEFEVNNIQSVNAFVKAMNRSYSGGIPERYSLPANKKTISNIQQFILKGKNKPPMDKFVREDLTQLRISGQLDDIGSLAFKERKDHFDAFVKSSINTDIFQPKITGSAYLIDRSNHHLAENMMWGLLAAFGIVSLIMGLLYKSLKIVLISLVPNIVPLLIIGAIMGFTGLELKASTAIIFTVAFGIAVDDTIHFMSKLKIELMKGKSLLYSIKRTFISTGKAIIVTSIILVTGFVSMLLSNFEGTFYTGLLVSITLFFAVIADLLLVPILLIFFYKKK